MFTTLTYTNNQAEVLDFLATEYGVSDWNIAPEVEVDNSRPRPQQHDMYGTPTYRRGMTIDIAGDIKGSSFNDYVTKRLAMVSKIFGNNFENLVSENQTGTLTLGLSGQTENWEVDVAVQAFSAPKAWNEGAYSVYMVTFFAFKSYFTGVTTPANKYRWA